MQHVIPQQSVMNTVAWVITTAGALSFIACLVGAVYVLVRPEARLIYTDSSLHDTYYVMASAKTVLLPLLLAAFLSGAIVLIGYSRTDYYLRQRFSPFVKQMEKP
jgi:hypothetical protein